LLNIPALVAVSGIKYLQLIQNLGLICFTEIIGKIIDKNNNIVQYINTIIVFILIVLLT